MDPRRSERLSEALREANLEELINYEFTDPRIDVMGVAEVLITPDGKHARVRLNLNGDRAWQEQSLQALDHAKGFIKKEISSPTRSLPLARFAFRGRLSAEAPERVGQLLKRVRRGRPRDRRNRKKSR